MKKTIFTIGLMMCVAIGANAQETTTPNPVNPNAPKFKFENETVDYGTIEHNADGNREFKFTNTVVPAAPKELISNLTSSDGIGTLANPPVPPLPKNQFAGSFHRR